METGARAIYMLFDAFCAPSAAEGEADEEETIDTKVLYERFLDKIEKN